MGLAKDIVKDNRKILLLTLGLFLMSVIAVFLLKDNFLTLDTINTQTYTKANDVLQKNIDYSAIIRTEYGDITIDLYQDQSPNAVNSFVFLSGENYYDNLTFYKVIKDFVIQTGDQAGDGTGDPGYSLDIDTNNLQIQEYSVCMANASQFFIVLPGADLTQLQEYPVIGEVTDGFAVVDTIGKVPVDNDYRPINDVTINSILIIEE